MLLKYFPIIFWLNPCFASYGLYGIKSGIRFINAELNSVQYLESFRARTRWIEQKLDNFDPKETRVWKMKYFERLTYWRHNGPIYLFLGGESPASSQWTGTGTMYELAKETHGAMFVSEHRYYGESKPLNGTDAKTFKYLSARQALADNANLLLCLKRQRYYRKSKVVVIGGSYAGNLAAWMKLLYPDLVDAAIASSGPVLAKTDFFEYLEKVNENYELYGTNNCLDIIRKEFDRYNTLFQNSEGIEQLKKEENICGQCDMSIPENMQLFFSFKVEEYMGNSQYGTTGRIKSHCKRLEIELANKTSQNESANRSCVCYDFDEMIEEFYDRANDWILAWFYQTCTEFGYYQTTSSQSQPFTRNIPLDFYIKICMRLFGPDFNEKRIDEGVSSVNEMYGALQLNVTNVVFSNGDLDPWSTLSILEDLSYDAPAVVISKASHCRDLFSDRLGDTEELKEARNYIKFLIKHWIGVEKIISSVKCKLNCQ